MEPNNPPKGKSLHPAKGWHESKREFEINDKGEYVLKHVTMEEEKEKVLGFDKKDFWDQVIKSVGIVAIVIPLILFKCSRDASIEEQKSMLQLELFSNVLSDIQRIILLPDTSAEFRDAKNKIEIDYYSKMMMLGNERIVRTYRDLKDTINMFSLIAASNHLLDTMFLYVGNMRANIRQQSRSAAYKDSIVRKRSTIIERTGKRWMAIFNLINSGPIGDTAASRKCLKEVLYALNTTQPYIQTESEKAVDRPINLIAIDSLATEFFTKMQPPKQAAAMYEKALKAKIETYYHQTNDLMKKLNKIL